MQNEPLWLPVCEIVEINRLEVEQSGETHFIREENLLHSAASRPRNAWAYEGTKDIGLLAVKLMLGIARNHPFEQGNKRTGFVSAIQFLESNGWSLTLRPDRELSQALIDVLDNKLPEDDFAYVITMNIMKTSMLQG